MKRFLLMFLVVLAAIVAATTILPPSAHATQIYCAGYKYDGYYRSDVPSVGSTTDTTVTVPSAAPTVAPPDNFEAAWVGVDNSNPSDWRWLQAGIRYDYGSSYYVVYTEEHIGSNNYLTYWSTVSYGSNHTFKVGHVGATTWKAVIDGITYLNNIDLGNSPNDTQIMTEHFHNGTTTCNQDFSVSHSGSMYNGASTTFLGANWSAYRDTPWIMTTSSNSAFSVAYFPITSPFIGPSITPKIFIPHRD